MKNNSIPEIRFPGFNGDWEQRKLGEVYTERKEKGCDSLQILSVSIHRGVSNEELDSDTLGKKVSRSEDKSLYKHVYFGDLVLNMMRAWQGAIGVVKSEGMVSPAYITANPTANLYPLFMDYYLRRDEAISQINNLSYGVTDFRKRLYWDSFINILCRIPSVPEQEKITAYFTQLDNTIALYQQELDILRQTKQGFLEKMFPRVGESVPEIRFPGFTATWEQRKLGEVLIKNSQKNKDLAIENVESVSNKTGFTKQTEQFDDYSVASADLSNYYVIREKQFAYNPSRINVGSIAYKAEGEETSVVSPLYVSFSTTHRLEDSYLWNWFKTSGFERQRQTLSEGGVRDTLSFNQLAEMYILAPNKEEQQKIGAFFKAIDDTITLHQSELDALKNTKKAFLQKMFV